MADIGLVYVEIIIREGGKLIGDVLTIVDDP